MIEDDPALLARLHDSHSPGEPERAVSFAIAAWDVNCPQQITPRYDEAQIAEAVAPLKSRIVALEAELAALRDL